MYMHTMQIYIYYMQSHVSDSFKVKNAHYIFFLFEMKLYIPIEC